MPSSSNCLKTLALIVGLISLIIAIALAFIWPLVFKQILTKELALRKNSTSYDLWEETPIPMYLEVYFFDWINHKEYEDDTNQIKKIKPKFIQKGPYTFTEKHYRVNVKWNDNNTVTYQQRREWHFVKEKSNGTLYDQITNINVIVAAASYSLRLKPALGQKAFDILMRLEGEKMTVTKTVKELLFEGYDDKLIDLMRTLNVTNFNIPYDKFGWFYPRQNSTTYDGVFNMYTGVDVVDNLGRLHSWNYQTESSAYPSDCNHINGTTGEIWPPMYNDYASMFISDICSPLILKYEKTEERFGLPGSKYVAQKELFDNGTKIPSRKCFNVGDVLPSGVLNISSCRFGAPAFVSYPHFYNADPIYLESVDGLSPNQSDHESSIVFEPNTGIPLNVNMQLQINILIERYDAIKMFSNVPRTLLPALWFRQYAYVTENIAAKARLVVNITRMANYTLIAIGCIGLVFLTIFAFLSLTSTWKKSSEVQHLIDDHNINS